MDVKIVKTEENQKYDDSILKNSNESNKSIIEHQQDGKEYSEDSNDENDNSLDSVGFLSGDLTKK